MNEAYVVDAVRTPTGKRNGGLAQVHPVDLAAHVIRELLSRTALEPALVDDVIFGCVDQLGAQSMNIARNAWLSAGFPESVPGVTVERQCGSSQQALAFAAQVIRAGDADCMVAGGVEVMSSVPMMSALYEGERAGAGNCWGGRGWKERFDGQEVSQFCGAELIAERWNLDREALEAVAVSSHQRAHAAWSEGRFDREVVPIAGVVRDEGIRPATSMQALAGLKPLREGGRITAGTASQISDGAAALLLASERFVAQHALKPLARVANCVTVGSDPVEMLTGPIPATRKSLARCGLKLEDIGLFECNEAFASVVLAWQKTLGIDPARVNVNGSGLSLGHPLGATGARIATTLVHEMARSGARFGLQTMCEGAGMANAIIFEIA